MGQSALFFFFFLILPRYSTVLHYGYAVSFFSFRSLNAAVGFCGMLSLRYADVLYL